MSALAVTAPIAIILLILVCIGFAGVLISLVLFITFKIKKAKAGWYTLPVIFLIIGIILILPMSFVINLFSEEMEDINENYIDKYGEVGFYTNQMNLFKVKSFVSKGYNVEGNNDYTPLMIACEHQYYDIAKYLIKEGADVNAVSGEGQSPLSVAIHNAEKKNGYKIIKYLIENGAEVDTGIEDIRAGIIYTIKTDDIRITELLLSYNLEIDVNCSGNSYNGSALVCAAGQGVSYKMVKYLIDNGGNINLTNTRGETALIVACGRYTVSKDIVELLIERGADVNAVSYNQTTALISLMKKAQQSLDCEVIELLIESGAAISAKDDEGLSAVDYLESNYAQDSKISKNKEEAYQKAFDLLGGD